nr:helix-turn-helix domain-containing protein [Achromobacter ruhlandii]
MSVEACKWARMADVQKSSSKLILLSLAQLVRYDAQDWTVFASIEYLAKITHLNRKTVIEALARLRQLGAIQDTHMRAGENRSSVVYRLCPNAVPRIDMSAAAHQADYQHASKPAQPRLDFAAPTSDTVQDAGDSTDNADRGVETHLIAERALAPTCSPLQEQDHALETTAAMVAAARDASPEIDSDLSTPRLATSTALAAAEVPSGRPATPAQMKGAHSRRHRRISAPTMYSGAGATRLPADWSLPSRWRTWAQRERPHWPAEKIDAIAATFGAYMRSRPGEAGMSEDWFESWRLWVFREWDRQSSTRKSWQSSWTGIVAKGKALGLEQAPDEPPPAFKARVFRAAGLAPPP